MHARRRDLGKERLEDEIVIGVDELDLDLAGALPRERLSSEHAAEAAADHEDFLLIHGQQFFLPEAIPTPMLHCVKSRHESVFCYDGKDARLPDLR